MSKVKGKAIALLLAIIMVFGGLPVNMPAFASEAAKDSNVIVNPGLELDSAGTGWTFNEAGVESKNVHTGTNNGYVNGGRPGPGPSTTNASQTVTIPVTGSYILSGYFIGQRGGSLSAQKNGKSIAQVSFNSDTGYAQYKTSLTGLSKGDKITVVIGGGMGTVYFDDISLVRDDSDWVELALNPVFNNQSNYWTLTGEASVKDSAVSFSGNGTVSQTVTVPLSGYYKLSAKVNGGATLGVKKSDDTAVQSVTTAAGAAYQTVTLDNFQLEKNEDVIIYVTGSNGVKADDFSLTFDLSKVTPGTPSAASTSISGIVFVGNSVSGTYTYSDTMNYKEGKTSYRWLISDTENGAYTAIDGATSLSYFPTASQTSKYIKFEVTPADMFGFTGTTVLSAASQIGLNITQNYSFESGTSSWAFFGAVASSDTSVISPKVGSVQAVISPNTSSSNNRIDQVVTVPQSGVYTFSAYVAESKQTEGGTVGIRRVNGESILNMDIPRITSYNQLLANSISLEKGDQIEIYANGGNGTTYIDDFELKIDPNKAAPVFNNIKSFTVQNQIGSSDIHTNNHTVTFTMPYGTDLSALTAAIEVSDGATVPSAQIMPQNFKNAVVYTVTGSNGAVQQWTVICKTAPKGIAIDSSNSEIKEAFQWAVNKALSQVQTGKTGLLNVDERSTATSVGTFIPSYWAGYSYRSAFYIRDFVHQASGAHLAGLDTENFSMLKAFLSTASESSAWYPAWALNFDGSIFKLDHSSNTSFVREVPSVFELVQLAYEQYQWTGDERYINDPVLWSYYTKAMTDFISLHDTKKANGVAEGAGTGNDLNLGMASYNEQGNDQLIEAGDGIACQYAALVAYTNMLKIKGDTENAAKFAEKAEALKSYFNNTWGAADGQANYVRAYSANGKAFTDFGKENSWFMPMKGITAVGSKTTDYLKFIEASLETKEGLPTNIEACTYLPDTFFQWNQNDLAWKWMKYIIENRNTPHQNSAEGVSGNYPEVSYTLINQTVQGLMGIAPDAPNKRVVTCSHLPSDIDWLSLKGVAVGSNEIDVKNQGANTTLTNSKGSKALTWEAQFNGSYDQIRANGALVSASEKTINGTTVSYATVNVPAGETVVMSATNSDSGSKSKSKSETVSDTASSAQTTTFVSDTTTDFSVKGAYQLKLTSANGQVPTVVVGTAGVFNTRLVQTAGNDYYVQLTAIGQPGAKAGIYVNGVKLLVATVTAPASTEKSDTTGSFKVKEGKAYTFKITADAKPAFAAGTLSAFRVEFVKAVGRDYYFKVTAVGKAGADCGFYINSQKTPVAVATIR